MESLAGCVVLLTRDYPETTRVDGRDMEVWLRAPGGRPQPKLNRHLGSAFVVAADTTAVLVTAAHVARRMDGEARVSFRRPGGSRATVALAKLAGGTGPALPWVEYGHADVAALRLRALPAGLRGRLLPPDRLRRGARAPEGSEPLLVIGFPLGLFAERDFAPVVKRAHAASGLVRFYSPESGGPGVFFFLDEAALGGYSGGPVFTAPGIALAEPECVGLVSQTVGDEAGGHLTAVVPGHVIRRVVARAIGGPAKSDGTSKNA